MFFTGYHGTTLEAAHNIIKEGSYHISERDTEWLGSGIYFYPSFSDAYDWRTIDGQQEAEAILHLVVKVDDDAFLDLDTNEGQELYYEAYRLLCELQGRELSSSKRNASKNQCAIARILWDKCQDIQLLAGSFPTETRKIPIVKDPRPYRKEFCVRDNSYIKHTYIIERGDLDD